jgi:hypothetical protein
MASQMEELMQMVREMKVVLEDIQCKLNAPKTPVSIPESDNTWTIENHFNNILVKFSKGPDFNEFKNYLKELGGTWFVSNKAWKFPIVSSEQVINSIKEKFPNKIFVEN